ncbi:MAG: PAS domain S-box protein [Gemmatimonadaceae bacterium]|nr:PAS domain S-box protein [Gemmatimonadaceae bacterium]
MLDQRALFHGAADGMVVLSWPGEILAANVAMERLLGRPIAQLIGSNVADFVVSTELAAEPFAVQAIRRDGFVLTLRRLRHALGHAVPVEAMTSELPDGTLLSVLRDARARPEVSALQAAQARFEALAERLNAALCVTDPDDRTVYVNEKMMELTGYARSEMLGHDFGRMFLSEDEQAAHARRRADRKRGLSERYECTVRLRDGRTSMMEVAASPLTDGEGRFIGSVAVLTDVTERREREQVLAEREQRYRSLFEVMPLPSWVYESESRRILAVNPAAVERYGYSESDLLSMTVDDLRPALEGTGRVEHRYAVTGFDVARDMRHRSKDGATFPVEVVTHEMEFAGRHARIAVMYDMSERERMRERQEALAEQLMQAQKMEAVGRLAGGVAHDFNNLLSVVLGAAEQLDSELPEASRLREEVRDIRDSAARGAALTRQLLALGRRETRAPELMDLNAVVVATERLLVRALGRHVRLEMAIAPVPLTTVADPAQVEQCIVNLALNARDAMPDGGRLRLATRLTSLDAGAAAVLGVGAGAYVAIDVEDTGIGMEPATCERAFEPFFSTKPRSEGSGLGLSTVYGIAKQSHGAMTIDSAVGQGTRVTILLPRAEDDAPPDEAAPSPPRARGSILLVEDDPRVRGQAVRLLQRSGFTVLEADTGAHGLKSFAENAANVHAIVSDVMMPEMGGAEMIQHIRREHPEIPVVFVSGYTSHDTVLPLDARTQFLAKPYTIAALCEVLDSLIGARAD